MASISRDLCGELRKADLTHQITCEECRLNIRISDSKRKSLVCIETDFAKGLYPYHPLQWTVHSTLGPVSSDMVHAALKNVIEGEGYLMRALDTVSSLLEKYYYSEVNS